MTFKESIKTCFTKYANFKGRASRSEYWYWMLFVCIISLAVAGLSALFNIDINGDFDITPVVLLVVVFDILVILATAVPSIAVTVRRLHDINKLGWWYFLTFLPIIGDIIIIVWACKKGDDKANRYGELSTK